MISNLCSYSQQMTRFHSNQDLTKHLSHKRHNKYTSFIMSFTESLSFLPLLNIYIMPSYTRRSTVVLLSAPFSSLGNKFRKVKQLTQILIVGSQDKGSSLSFRFQNSLLFLLQNLTDSAVIMEY